MPQITSRISETLLFQIKELSVKEKRSLSTTIDLLLQQAIKEKMRKRNATKEGNSKHNTAD